MLAPAEELNAETEDWIWDTGAALDVASATVAGKRQVSFAPPILSAGGVVNSVESVVIEMAEIDEVVKEAEAAAVEGKVVETLRDVVAEEVLVPARGAPPNGWRVDRFPQGPGKDVPCDYSISG